jgi:hypothetical protein
MLIFKITLLKSCLLSLNSSLIVVRNLETIFQVCHF